MKQTEAFSRLFHIYDALGTGHLSSDKLHEMYDHIRVGGISLAQVLASMEKICGSSDSILLPELKDVLDEMDRRYFLVQDLQWEFALLDNQHQGTIPVSKARFLFEAIHGNMFSISKWNQFLHSRVLSDAPIPFSEIEVDLCDIPTPHDWDLEGKENIKRLEDIKEKKKREEKLRKEEMKRKREERLNVEKQKKKMEMLPMKPAEPDTIENNTISPNGNTDPADERSNVDDAEEMERLRSQEKEERKKRDKEEKKVAKKRARAAEHQRLYDKLEAAFESRNSERLQPAIHQYKEGVPRTRDQDELLTRAERLLEMLKCSAVLKDAMIQRVIADLENAITRAKKSGFDRSEEDLANEVLAASDLLLRLKRLEKLRNEVLELKQSTIAELRSYQKPIPVIHNVMRATYLLLGTTEKETKDWQNIQALLGKTGREGLKRRIGQCNVLKIQISTAKRARDVMGVVDLEAIRDVSAGAATFFVWAEGMIEEVESSSSNPTE